MFKIENLAFLGLLIFSLIAPQSVSAQGREEYLQVSVFKELISQLIQRVDAVANESNKQQENLGSELAALRQQIDDLRSLQGKLDNIEKRIIETELLKLELEKALRTAAALEDEVGTISINSAQALSSAQSAQSSAESTGWILTIVSTIVSFLVIIIGLFFSSRFMAIHAENQVAKALLERVEGELQSVKNQIHNDSTAETR
ncbi:MAG: hypothetical protein K5905_17960 [Roseibium sp.]|uniref:hypothetical protein n=1 Tax=Roseibium sp. TaxID=1936156 RepID=UPI002620B11E|nr:hypothetical protein [Roseibium sp.]MCV0427350.1 hypothetical protein [Roseibium sp.]